MKTRNTILLLLIAAGLFVYVRFYETKRPGTAEIEDQSKHLVTFDRDDINGITITNNQEKIELRRSGKDQPWRLEAPVKDRADAARLDQLLTSIEKSQKETTIDEDSKTKIKDFGVLKSNLRLKLLGRNAPPEILFGKDAAVEGKLYARLDGSKSVSVIGNELKNLITKKADDFRDGKLTNTSAAQVTKLGIKSAAGEVELQKDGDHWQINKPVKARADDAKVADLIAQTINARIDTFVPEKDANASATGLADPRGTVSIFLEGNDKPAVLHLGQSPEKESGKVYAKISTRDVVALLQKKATDILDIKPDDVRDKHLLRVNLDIVDRIHIQAAGKPKITLARKEENWSIQSDGDKRVNGAEVRRLAAGLQKQEVAAFVADVASDLPKYGLDQPQLKVTFSSYASENTAETKAGENPIVTVSFGKIDGDNVYARLEDEPFIVSVNKSVLDRVFTDPAQWQELAVNKLKPESIVALEVQKPPQPSIALSRNEKGGWQLATGEGAVNEINIQSLCNTLASLRAVRWTGGSLSGLGFEQPTLVISFTTADKKTSRLTIGSATAEGMWNAATDAASGAFVLSRPDVDALQATLTQPPASRKPAAPVLPGAKP